MRVRRAALFPALVGALAALCATIGLGANGAGASPRARILRPRAVTAQVASAAGAPRVTVQLSDPYVLPHHRTEILATVIPRQAGRVVTLDKLVGRHFVGVVSANTNRRGEAVLRAGFPLVGSIRLRALVAATPTAPAVQSRSVVEVVTTTLPFALPAGSELSPGESGPLVTELQQRLSTLGYWLGSPDGYFGDATEQAVWALQKADGLSPTGVVGTTTVAALNDDALPHPRSTSGYVIEVDLSRDLVMFVDNGKVEHVLNASSGGGYTYTEDGATDVAVTPRGIYHIYRATDGLVVDSLGALWRPRFFTAGFAIHGDSDVPPEPVSHGCVRVSDEAINWIWAANLAPIGTEVWLYE